MLKPLAPGLWHVERELKVGPGLRIPTRMLVVKSADGGVTLVSPVRLSDEQQDEIQRLGPVRHVVAPNRFHHMFVGEALDRFPGARAWAVPGLPEKRRDLSFDGVLGEHHDSPLPEEFQLQLIGEAPAINELVILHRPSRTLFAADLVFNLRDCGWLTRTVFRAAGSYGELRQSRSWFFFVKDKSVARASMSRIQSWDFDRLVMGHGQIVHTNARQELARALRVLRPS